MKKTAIISCIMAAMLLVGTLAGCADAKTGAAANDEMLISAANTVKPSPKDIDKSGVQGLIVRGNSDEVKADRLGGTTVTDVVLTLGENDAAATIDALKAAGINVYVQVDAVPADDAVVAGVAAILDKYDVNGIELDFISEGVIENSKDTYPYIDVVNKVVADVAAKLDTYEATYNHPISLSVHVATDFLINYNFGYDVVAWVNEGLVDMVCPATGGEVSTSNMPTRLWYSVLQPFGTVLAPAMKAHLQAYSGAASAPQTTATYAGMAAAHFSMGANKVCVEYDAVADDALNLLGSYSTLVNTDRRVVLTYTDLIAKWQRSDVQLPFTIGKNGIDSVCLPLGDIAEGTTVTIKIGMKKTATSGAKGEALTSASIYTNSDLASYSHVETCDGGFTKEPLYCYTLPASALDEGHVVAEMLGTNGGFTATYVELFVDAK